MTVIFNKTAYSLRPALRPTYYIYIRATQEYARADEDEEEGEQEDEEEEGEEEEEEEEENGWAAMEK